MASANEITGARLVSKPPSEEYQEGHERIFGSKGLKLNNNYVPPPLDQWVLGEPAASIQEDIGD